MSDLLSWILVGILVLVLIPLLFWLARTTLGLTLLAGIFLISARSAKEWLGRRGTKPFELAQLFVRLFRGLSAITGNESRSYRSWLKSDNSALGERPLALITSIEGLTRTLNYVDSRRARI